MAENATNGWTEIRLLRLRWRFIVAVVGIAGVLVALWSITRPPQYEATATVVIGMAGTQPNVTANTYIELARSPSVAQQISTQLGLGTQGLAMGSNLSATTGDSSNTVVLRVRDGSGERASQIVTAWATTLVDLANERFSAKADTVQQIEQQLYAAKRALSAADTALTDQEKLVPTTRVQDEIQALQNTLSSMFVSKSRLDLALTDAGRLKDRIIQMDPSSQGKTHDEIAILLLQTQLYGTTLQLDYGRGSLAPAPTVADEISRVDELTILLSAKRQDTDTQITLVQDNIRDCRAKLDKAVSTQLPFLTERNESRQLVAGLETKLVQARASAQEVTVQARLQQSGVSPATELPKKLIKDIAVGCSLALMLACSGALAHVSLHQPDA